jgi:excisionase family DNA binding protein
VAPEPLLRAEQVAEILGLPVGHVYRLAREDRIPHLKFGRSYRFRSESISQWLEERERSAVGR